MNIGIGFIGTGFARKVQMPAFRECDGAVITSVASARLANAESAAAEFGAPHFTGDWRETIAHPDVDLVCITTPPDTHCEITLAALAAGKHVLAEKPMAMNLGEAVVMAEAARGAGVLALIDHELRFQRGRRVAFEMLRAGEIGRVRHASASFRAPHRGDPSIPWNWWSDKDSGGGSLGAIGSHLIDSFNWFLGAPVDEVYCRLQTHVKTRVDEAGVRRDVTTDDEASLVLKFGAGGVAEDATATISASMAEYPAYRNRLEFFGTEGAMRLDALGELFIGKPGSGDWTRIPTDLGRNVEGVGDTGFARGFLELAPAIIETIRAGRTHLEHAAIFDDGVAVQKVIDAAHESNESGRVVRVG